MPDVPQWRLDLAKEIDDGYNRNDFHTWRDIDDEVRRIASPLREGDIDQGPATVSTTDNMFDVKTREASGTMVNGIVGKLTPQTSRWVNLKADPQATEANIRALDNASDRVWNEFVSPKNNFYSAWPEGLSDLIHFGGINISAEKGDRRYINFQTIETGKYVFELDHEGFADMVWYKFRWSAYECFTFFGEKGLPEKILAAYRNPTKRSDKFEIIHRVMRRRTFSTKLKIANPEKREFESIFVSTTDRDLIGIESKRGKVTYKDGLYNNRFHIERYNTKTGQTRGEGITTMMAPLIREANHRKKSVSKATDFLVEPVLAFPDDGEEPDAIVPGGKYFYNPIVDKPPAVVHTVTDVQAAMVDLESIHQSISEAYFEPLFKIFTNQDIATTRKTAFESQLMSAEQLGLLTTGIKGMTSVLRMLIDTVFDIMLRDGRFDDIEDDFPKNYEVEIVSPLAKALETARMQDFMSYLELAAALDPIFPGLKHIVDTQKEARENLLNGNIPTENIRTEEEVTASGEEELQSQKNMQDAQTANLVGDAIVKGQQAE